MQWCQTQILPMIKEANISYNLIQTGNAGGRPQAAVIIGVSASLCHRPLCFCASQSDKTTPES